MLARSRSPLAQAVEHHEVDPAALEVAAVAHHEDEADLPDAEDLAAVVEVAASAVVAEAVVSQEVDVVVVALVAVDVEDTKRFGLGRLPPHPGYAGEARPFALPFRLEPTITHRYHDHLAAFWSCDGITVTCRDMAPCCEQFKTDARVIF